MISAQQALSLSSQAEALPRIKELEPLYKYGFVPRRGQFLLIAGMPGAQKSGFALWWAVRMNRPTLYISPDMDSITAISRLAACLIGKGTEEIVSAIDNGAWAFFEDALLDCNIQFCFDSSPSISDVADEIDAYVELWDRFPEIIVIDNAMNIETGMGEDNASLRVVFKEVHRMGRETGAAVFMLHHTREEGSPLVPQARSAIQGKPNQLPERILTCAFNGENSTFSFSPVKNRSGPQDPTAQTVFRLNAFPGNANFVPYVSSPVWRGYDNGEYGGSG